MQIGMRKIDDILINLGNYKKVNVNYGNKQFILQSIYKHDYAKLREISNYFYESSGIYYRLCNYLGTIYRFDWYITPYIRDLKKDRKKLENDFWKVLSYLDNSEIKRMCSLISIDIIKEGVYYGIVVDFGDKFSIQKLPANYCRCRYFSGTNPIVELNLQFFNDFFSNIQTRLQIIKTFPKDIQKAYILYQQGKLKGDYPGERGYWYALDPDISVKLNFNGNDFPPFVGVIPSIIDLDQAQELDRKKTMQQLLKIIVQKLPLDKNGDLIFDMDEAKDIHNGAVEMLRRAVGIDVLTTFADIQKIDTKDANSATTTDDLEKVERTVFNNSGVSHNLFNAEGNLAVTNSVLVDESSIKDLPFQFSSLLNRILRKFNRINHYEFKLTILETTQFNYKEISKMYKEHAQMGYSKMLPQIALGIPQSVILSTFVFENDILNLAEKMIPPLMSSTMSGIKQDKNNQSNQSKIQNNQTGANTTEKSVGRPEKEDNQKSDKTIANQESSS